MHLYKTFILLVLLTFSVNLHAELTPEKRAEIEKMLKLTGSEKMVDQMMTQMISSMRTGMPQAPGDFWDKFCAKIKPRELMDQILPVYDKYYTLDDLKALNAFYSSPVGQKVMATLPQVMQESMQIGQAWGQKIAAEAVAEIEATKKTTK